MSSGSPEREKASDDGGGVVLVGHEQHADAGLGDAKVVVLLEIGLEEGGETGAAAGLGLDGVGEARERDRLGGEILRVQGGEMAGAGEGAQIAEERELLLGSGEPGATTAALHAGDSLRGTRV
jgi:hypothetical protein